MSQANISVPISVEHVANSFTLMPARMRVTDSMPKTELFKTELFTFLLRETSPPRGPFDPWLLREDFLTWPSDRWKDFIAKTGLFNGGLLTSLTFADWQRILRDALILPPEKWGTLFSENALEYKNRLVHLKEVQIRWDGKAPRLLIRTEDALDVIIATVQIDKLRGAEFRVCARHDCKSAPFRVEARQKIYCCNDCAHLVAVRNSRKRAAERAGRK